MSDLHLVTTVPENRHKKEKAVKWINANTAIQNVLQQLNAEERKEVVMRCDELPHLQGLQEDVEKIFSVLLQMILQKKSAVSRLFLHISCKITDEELMANTGWHWFSIQFHTNIIPCFDWMKAHKQNMAEIAAILKKSNGSLEVAQVNTQGCIFSLSIPGKFFE